MRVGKRAIKGINVLCYHILFSMNNVVVAVVQSLNHVQLFATPDCSLPGSSVEVSRQEYWSGLLFLSPGDRPNLRLELASPILVGRFFTSEPPGKPI